MRRISTQATTSYDALLSEAMEDKLYYYQDTCSPVEFAELVEAEVRRLKETIKVAPKITLMDLIRSLKEKISKGLLLIKCMTRQEKEEGKRRAWREAGFLALARMIHNSVNN